MSKTVKVTYDSSSLQTAITVDGKPFDTSRIDGKEIADWAYPFMMRKVRWNGFYDEMVVALGGEKAFDLIFEGAESDLKELQEAWESAPVRVISEGESGNIADIVYDESTQKTTITVNGQPFDTSRIQGKEIADWVYPFMMRKVKWDGIFEELAKVVGSSEYTIQFSGSNAAMQELMEGCPESVVLKKTKVEQQSTEDCEEILGELVKILDNENASESEKANAFAQVRKLAEQGYANAQYSLGDCYYFGNGVTQDYAKAVEWYQKAAEQGYAKAQYSLGICYNGGWGVAQDYAKAIEWYQKATEQGYAEAQYSLGNCYYFGDGVAQDYAKAVEWYQKAAEQEYPGAQYQLGKCYYCGRGVTQDYAKAVGWYQKIADRGFVVAQYRLGNCYYDGKGVAQDYTKAAEWYQKAAEQGNDDAQYRLGSCYYVGEGVSQDYAKTVEWLQKAAEQGNAGAQYGLGCCYHNGEGVPQNYEKAVEWLQKAAEQGNAGAQNDLGSCYQNGEGVAQDYAKAAEWYQKAADQGLEIAQTNLNGLKQQMEPGLLGTVFQKGKEFVQSDSGKAFLSGAAKILGAYAEGHMQAKRYLEEDDDYY